MPLCTITGTVYLPSGEPARSRVLVFRRGNRNITGSLIPEDTLGRTTSAGEITITLTDGKYTVFCDEFSAAMTVPLSPTATFASTVLPENQAATPNVVIVTELPAVTDPNTFYVIPQ